MGTLATILTLILVFSFFVFVTFFGRLPALKNTPVASLHKLLWVHIPQYVLEVDRRATGGRLTSSVSRFANHMLYDRHPTVIIVFLGIMLAGYIMYFPAIWPLISPLTKITTSVAAILPLIFLYLSCAADPGYITPETLSHHMTLYPYDYALFRPGSECRTCKLPKPPRSKHCSICKRCVAKSDHHCVFINSCVGYGNHRWFLLLLFTTAIMTSYGGLLGLNLMGQGLKKRYPTWTLLPSRSLGGSYTRWVSVWGYGLRGNVPLGSTTLLAFLTSPLVWGLSIYTLYQVYTGVTTNESLKWTELKEDMEDGYAWQRPLSPRRARDLTIEPRCDRWPVEPERIIVATVDGLEPKRPGMAGEGEWVRVRALREVENIYDMGFWDNIGDVFVKDYAFGEGLDEPIAERRRKKR